MNAKDDYFHRFLRINLSNFHDFPCFFSFAWLVPLGWLSFNMKPFLFVASQADTFTSSNEQELFLPNASVTYIQIKKNQKCRELFLNRRLITKDQIECTATQKSQEQEHSLEWKWFEPKVVPLTTQTEKNEPGNCFCNYTWCFSLESLLLSITIFRSSRSGSSRILDLRALKLA